MELLESCPPSIHPAKPEDVQSSCSVQMARECLRRVRVGQVLRNVVLLSPPSRVTKRGVRAAFNALRDRI